jgi:hypothetical protein
MKNLILKSFVMVALATSIIACSKEETTTPIPEPTEQELVLGDWNVSKFIIYSKLGGSVQRNDTTSYNAGTYTFKFTATKAYKTVGMEIDTFSYTFANKKITMIQFNPIKNGNDTTIYNYVKVTSDSLIIADRDTTSTLAGPLISNTELRMKR